jgi:hypothetical protein
MPDEVAILLDKLLGVHKIHMQILVLCMHIMESFSVVQLESRQDGRRSGVEKKEVMGGWKFF